METSRPIGFLLGVALLGALTGCTTYVEQSNPPTVYVAPLAVSVEAPRVYVPPPPAYEPPPAGVEVSAGVEIRAESDFYEPLTPYGHWEMIEPYGRCWVPGRVDPDWRPYCNGHWERTEAGWFWASDEPWAWATYHYGRWDLSPQFGWFWVPQVQWAPAWVSWHHGGGYFGWAPLQPSVTFSVGRPVEVDVARIPRRGFVVVEEKHFLEPVRPATVINNSTIINQTVNITNIKVENNSTVINEGPRVQVIEQASGRKVRPVSVHELRHKEEAAVAPVQRNAPPPRRENTQIPPARPQPEPRENRAQPVPPSRAETVQTPPVRNQPEPHENKVQPVVDQRERELHQRANEQSQRVAQELQRKAQLESEQHARDLQKKAQEEAEKNAKELERKAQLQADQHSRELHQKAQEESQRHARELEEKAQLETKQHARDLQMKAQEAAQAHAKELEKNAQLQAEKRSAELHQKAAQDAARNAQAEQRAKERQPADKQRGTNAVHKGHQ